MAVKRLKIAEMRKYLLSKGKEISDFLRDNGHENADVVIEIWKDDWSDFYAEIAYENGRGK